MSTSTQNPYQSPQTAATDPSSSRASAQVDWKLILRRWEILRIPFNVIVGFAGLLALAMAPSSWLSRGILGVLAYGFCANVMYLLGPIAEMYLNWFVDAWEGRLVPKWLAGLIRSRYTTALLFVGGCLFSVGLTLAIGLSQAFAAALPDQQ